MVVDIHAIPWFMDKDWKFLSPITEMTSPLQCHQHKDVTKISDSPVAFRLLASFYQLMVWNYLNEVVGTICQGLKNNWSTDKLTDRHGRPSEDCTTVQGYLVYYDEVILVILLWSKLLVGVLIPLQPKMTIVLGKVGQPKKYFFKNLFFSPKKYGDFAACGARVTFQKCNGQCSEVNYTIYY